MAVSKLYKESVIFIKLLHESVLFAFSQLKGDKFRTFLSLFGVSIGIFSIVAIFTAIDALQDNVRRGFDSLSSDIIQVSKWPMMEEGEDGGPAAEYRWWEYMKRPTQTYEEYKFIKSNSKLGRDISIFTSVYSYTSKYKRNSVKDTEILCVSYDFEKLAKMNVERGRYFSPDEGNNGAAVAILGNELAQNLFAEEDPIGKKVSIGTTSVTVIGVLEKMGESMVSLFNSDQALIMPYSFGKYFINLRWADNTILARPKEGASSEDFIFEIKSLLRAARHLKPNQKDNFSVAGMTFLLDSVNQVFSLINLVGWIIAGFSLLIGGFGIANIMFVSVKERTNMIGIQKALGAKRYVIMSQFLVEAAVLAIAGGLIGILLVFIIVMLIPATDSFTLTLSFSNIIWGVLIASVIGLLSGLIPAWVAANLNPVDAINSK